MVTVAVSPAGAVRRLLELAVVFGVFVLSRQHAHERAGGRRLAAVLFLTFVVEVILGYWYRRTGTTKVLGIWKPSWGFGVGTFANPNHFANWVYVTALFLLGLTFRAWGRAQGRSPVDAVPGSRLGEKIFGGIIVLACLAGASVAVAGGSRGGVLTMAVGLGVWGWLLRSQRRGAGSWRLLGLVAVLLVVAGLLQADYLFNRIHDLRVAGLAQYAKWAVWGEGLHISARFPWLGVGVGGWDAAFGVLKQGFGKVSVWHAENEPLELLVEMGFPVLICVICLCGYGVRVGFRLLHHESHSEHEMVCGAVAALVAYGFNCIFDFVWQIPANAVLAAALAGYVCGQYDRAFSPKAPAPASRGRVLANAVGAAALIAAAMALGFAEYAWRKAMSDPNPVRSAALIQKSLGLWPWATERRVAWLRSAALDMGSEPGWSRTARLAEVIGYVNSGLRLDPLNWSLRLERAWLTIAFGDRARGLELAVEVARLNRRQIQIPLRFARHYADKEPEVALQFVVAATAEDASALADGYKILWDGAHDTGLLWRATPDAPEALVTLAGFAAAQGLQPMALECCHRLRGRIPDLRLGELLAGAGGFAEALPLAQAAGSDVPALVLLVRIHHGLGHYREAVETLRRLVLAGPNRDEIVLGRTSARDLYAARALWLERPDDRERASDLVERIAAEPPERRDISLLRRVRERHPNSLRFLYVLCDTEAETKRWSGAAGTALELATRLEPSASRAGR